VSKGSGSADLGERPVRGGYEAVEGSGLASIARKREEDCERECCEAGDEDPGAGVGMVERAPLADRSDEEEGRSDEEGLEEESP
jgi:hypothetical protein